MRKILGDNFLKSSVAALAVALGCFAGVSGVRAQYRMDVLPEGMGQNPTVQRIVDKANTPLPLDLDFTRSDGQSVKLASLFHSNKPVIVSLVYFSCPNLCGFNQDELTNDVKDGPRNLSLGRDYNIVIVSIDPDDTSAAAATKKSHYADMMNRKPDDAGLTYLTGSEANIKQLADAIGFPFHRNLGGGDKFAHDTGIFICTPEGILSHTISGVSYPPDELHFRLVEASHGKIGSGFLSLGLTCGAMYFNAKTGQYEHNPYFYAGTAGGLVTIVMLGGFLAYLFKTENKRKPPQQLPPVAPSH